MAADTFDYGIIDSIYDPFDSMTLMVSLLPDGSMKKEVIASIAGMGPERVVYVSCDPATLGRDVKVFAGLGYRADRACAVDLFPGTRHVETVVLLSKFDSSDRTEV